MGQIQTIAIYLSTGIRKIFPKTHSYVKVNVSPSSQLSLRRKILSLMQSLFLDLMVFLRLCLYLPLWGKRVLWYSAGECTGEFAPFRCNFSYIQYFLWANYIPSYTHSQWKMTKKTRCHSLQTRNIWCPSLGENSQSTGSPRLFNNSVKDLPGGSKLTDSI